MIEWESEADCVHTQLLMISSTHAETFLMIFLMIMFTSPPSSMLSSSLAGYVNSNLTQVLLPHTCDMAGSEIYQNPEEFLNVYFKFDTCHPLVDISIMKMLLLRSQW